MADKTINQLTSGTIAGTDELEYQGSGGGNSRKTTGAAVGNLATQAGIKVGTSAIASGADTKVLYNNAGVLGEYTVSGSGSVAMTNSPAFTTPTLGTPGSGTLTNCTGLLESGLTLADNITNNVSTTRHGFTPKAPNDATKFLDGTGAWSVPAGSGSGNVNAAATLTASQIVLGAGSTDVAKLGSLGTTTTVLHGNAAGAPTWAAVDLSTDVTGVIPQTVNNQTGTSYTIDVTDNGVLVTFNNSLAIAVTLPQATSSFATFNVMVQNIGAGLVTITPTTSTIDGASSVTLATGQGMYIVAKSGNYNTMRGKTSLAGATPLPAGATIDFALPTVDGTATGPTCSAFNSGYSSSAVGDLVYLDSSGTWQKADADVAAAYEGMLAIALEVKASGSALKVALPGSYVYATGFPTFTVGGAVYMSQTAGAVTQTKPTATDSAVRPIGAAFHADKLFFNPAGAWVVNV